MTLRPSAAVLLLVAIVLLPGRAQGQLALDVSVRSDRYTGNSRGLLDTGIPVSLRPTTPELFAVHLTRTFGDVRLGLGIGRASAPISGVADGGVLITPANNDRVTEFDLEIARRFAGRAGGPRLWGYATPAIAYWTLSDTERWNLSGTLGLELESPVTGPLTAYTRVALGVQRTLISPQELPEGFTTKPLWRRSLGLGLRARL